MTRRLLAFRCVLSLVRYGPLVHAEFCTMYRPFHASHLTLLRGLYLGQVLVTAAA